MDALLTFALANTVTGFATPGSAWPARGRCSASWSRSFLVGLLFASASNRKIVYPFFAMYALWHVVGACGFVALWAFDRVRFREEGR